MEEKEIVTSAPETEVPTQEAAEVKTPRQGADKRPSRRQTASRRALLKKDYEERVIHISRVTKVVKGGKRMKFSALVVIGNGKGKYGYGFGKSIEVPEAIKKGLAHAKNHVMTLPIVKNGTIPHSVVGEFGVVKVFLKPAPEGTGIVAGGAVRTILELAGVKDVYSKVYGSRSSAINVIKATVDGLRQLRTTSLAKETLKVEEEQHD